jgi:hypothetical protein
LPITTIYILGFTLPEIESPCIKVERNYKDLISKAIITNKSEFVEKLTHDSFVVQIERITNRYQTRLDKLLSIFEQRHFVDDQKITKQFTHETDEEELKIITDILHHSGTDPESRRQIEIEQEAWRSIDAMFADKEKAFQKALAEKEKALADKEKALADKDKALDEKDKMMREQQKALEDMAKQIEELKRR